MLRAVRRIDDPAREARCDAGTAPVGRRIDNDDAPIFGPVPLRDGSVVLLRRATDLDADALRGFYLGLSGRTLFRRFMTPTPRLPEGSLAYLCDVHGLDREVILATCDGEIVGEGRYHRVAGTGAAEVALVVADGWQGRGIGPALSERLARLARLRGIEAFTGTMLADNDAARRLLGSVAPDASVRVSSGELDFLTTLPGA